ncbi:hypothetical protein [Sphingomonas mesophila]|uniref:hypothetical protein n=1 Tax=Sphingomonas mesophila TaxID=2303576 RepID=UPI0013C321E8|nr:hypothetical protein [Sphingomonas mesophila]
MGRGFGLIAAALAAGLSAPVEAAPSTLALVNATGSDISTMEARRSGGGQWSAIPYTARSGAAGSATFDTSDCAWDLRVKLADGASLTFANVNLCEAQLLTLRRRDGVVWVDYR